MAGVVGIGAWILGPTSASGDSTLSLQIASVDWRGKTGAGYDVFDAAPYSQTVDFIINKQGGACSYFVTFSKNTPGNNPRVLSSGGETLNYQLYDTTSLNNVLKDLPSASATEVISGRFTGGTISRQVSFVMAMPALQIKRAGTYTDSVQVQLYIGTLSRYTLAQSVVITITARVPQLASVAVVAAGQDFDPQATTHLLNFGQLADGQTLGFDLRVRSNAGYSVSLDSENRGLLKNLDLTSSDTVPYVMRVGGVIVPLSIGPQVALARSGVMTTVNGDRYPVEVAIGTVGDAGAGSYRDVVTVTVQANN